MRRILKAIDIPPTWLVLFLALAWGLDRLVPGLGPGWPWLRLLGDGLIVVGLVLMSGAVIAFLRAHTTFVPRREPTAFVHTGFYRFSRNPIYLGDALVLTGAILHWDVLPALVLVPLFMALITRRFIKGEEAVLRARYGEEYDRWAARVRRWL